MADAQDKERAAARFLRRVKTRVEIEDLAVMAFNGMSDGTIVIGVSGEGGSTTAVLTCEPHTLLNACETILQELTDAAALAADPADDEAISEAALRAKSRRLDFHGGLIEP